MAGLPSAVVSHGSHTGPLQGGGPDAASPDDVPSPDDVVMSSDEPCWPIVKMESTSPELLPGSAGCCSLGGCSSR